MKTYFEINCFGFEPFDKAERYFEMRIDWFQQLKTSSNWWGSPQTDEADRMFWKKKKKN